MQRPSQSVRPLELLERGRLHELMPNIDHCPEARQFLEFFLPRNSSAEQKTLRQKERQQILDRIECAPIPTRDIKVVIFDVDQTKGLLYPISSSTGAWAIGRLAGLHGLDTDRLYAATRQLRAEYLCHSPHEFLHQLADATGHRDALNPDNRANSQIMADWRDVRKILNRQWVFKDIEPGIKQIKDAGGLVYVGTAGPPASVLHRLFLWFGPEGHKYFDGVSVLEPLAGMSPVHAFACDGERKFVECLEADGKIIITKEKHVKPRGEQLLNLLKHANDTLRPDGAPKIRPRSVVMVGDSLGSDGGAARDLFRLTGEPAQFAFTVKGLVVDPEVHRLHALVGNEVDKLGSAPVMDKIRSGNYVRPQIAITNFYQFFDTYRITPAFSPEEGSVKRHLSALTSSEGAVQFAPGG